MKKRILIAMALCILAIAAMMPKSALAAGTSACTVITNTANVEYEVAGATSTINSNTATMTVSVKVNMSVVRTDAAAVQVAPGATNKYLSFLVTNLGNETQDFGLTGSAKANGTADPFGGAQNDNFDATGYLVRVESGATPGYQAGEDTATYLDEFAPDATATVYIVGTAIPGTQVDGDLAVYALNTKAKDAGGVGVEGADTAEGNGTKCGGDGDVVFGDDDGIDDDPTDGISSDRSAFKVVAVVLGFTKTAVLISDPVHGTTGPKYIPGAIVEYRLKAQVTSGSGSVTNIKPGDVVPNNTTALEDVADYGGTGEIQRITYDEATTTTTTDNLDAADPDVFTWGTAATSSVSALCSFTLNELDDYCEIRFRVQID